MHESAELGARQCQVSNVSVSVNVAPTLLRAGDRIKYEHIHVYGVWTEQDSNIE